jgi:hypothetical protein
MRAYYIAFGGNYGLPPRKNCAAPIGAFMGADANVAMLGDVDKMLADNSAEVLVRGMGHGRDAVTDGEELTRVWIATIPASALDSVIRELSAVAWNYRQKEYAISVLDTQFVCGVSAAQQFYNTKQEA